jgi:hypothetical protein
LAEKNIEIEGEAGRVINHLTQKKNELNHIEFQTQDVIRKLSSANLELERATFRIREADSEERSCELKIEKIREELRGLIHLSELEKTKFQKNKDEAINLLLSDKNNLLKEIEENKKEVIAINIESDALKLNVSDLELSLKT